MATTIKESFTQEEIGMLETDLSPQEEMELSNLFNELWEGDIDQSTLQMALLAFVAGRTHERGNAPDTAGQVTLTLDQDGVQAFIDFLIERSQ